MINICFQSDENYIQYMATTIVSILQNSLPTDRLFFYILCNNVSDRSKEAIKSLKKIKDCEILFIDVDINEFKDFPSGGPHITNTTYYRYKIAELLPNVSKIIYLDCDVIVKTSLAPLFNTDITDYYIAGVEDVGYYYGRTCCPEYIYRDGLYVNAGVLLINMQAWRENSLFDKFMDFTTKESDKIKIGDQDVINQVCLNKIKKLDYKWNVQDSFFRKKPEREFNPNCQLIIEAANFPAIIHYTNTKKPWNSIGVAKSKEFWKYYIISPFVKKARFEYIKLFILYYPFYLLSLLVFVYHTPKGIYLRLFNKIKLKLIPFKKH